MTETNSVDKLLMDYDVESLVLGEPMDEDWQLCSVSILTKDHRWVLGMTLITPIREILDCAERNGLAIIFESMLEGYLKSKHKQ